MEPSTNITTLEELIDKVKELKKKLNARTYYSLLTRLEMSIDKVEELEKRLNDRTYNLLLTREVHSMTDKVETLTDKIETLFVVCDNLTNHDLKK